MKQKSGDKKNRKSKILIKDLPKVGSLWVLLGPAFVWAATAQGSGELIWWPYLVARYGKAFLFLLLPFALIQFFVNREISKFTAVTGEGIWRGFLSIGKLYALPLFLFCFVNFLWFGGYATAGGSSLYEVLKWPSGISIKTGSLLWAYVLVVVFSIALLLSKVIYKFIENVMKVVTVITITGLSLSVILVGKWVNVVDFVDGLFNPLSLGVGVDWGNFDYSKLITALVFAGMGGFLNLMYSYWMKDKGVGMAGFSEKIRGIFSEKKSQITNHKSQILIIENNEKNRKRWRGWTRYLNMDSGLAVGINMLTIILTSFLSFVLLWPERNYPEGWSITVAQSAFFESSFGSIGRIVFLVVAAAFLVDTWLALVDGVSRQFADFMYGWIGNKWWMKDERSWYYFWLIFLIIVSLITMPLAEPGVLMKLIGVISVFAFVFYIPALWYLNYVKLPAKYPEFVKSGLVSGLMLWLVWGVYTALAGWYLYQLRQ
ncbi:Nramp family divalent metal transporter [Patescibacteria group bacterium]|nr:Nramp family divalent metal transporter [Patescibacteria group bacterium]